MRLLRAIAHGILRLGRWEAVGGKLDVPKAVLIAYPHTSNWDGLWALTYKVAVGLDLRFFGKHTLFWFPLGTLLRALGGIPLDRSTPGSAVDKAVKALVENDSFYFALAPEGTRRYRPFWKTGFYRIAERANVPVVLCFMDYNHRRIGTGPVFEITGDREADMKRIAEFYEDVGGHNPEKAAPIVFADE